MNLRTEISAPIPRHKKKSGETFFIKPTTTTPFVVLDYSRKKLVLKGRSYPVASIEFYNKIALEIKSYLKRNDNLSVIIALEYFNTSSAKCIYDILKVLKYYTEEEEKTITVNWLYESEDEDMKETGEDYMAILDWNLNLTKYTF